MSLTTVLHGCSKDPLRWTEIDSVRLRAGSSEDDLLFFEMPIKISYLFMMICSMLYVSFNVSRRKVVLRLNYNIRFAVFNARFTSESMLKRLHATPPILKGKAQDFISYFCHDHDSVMRIRFPVQEYANSEHVRRGSELTYTPFRNGKSEIRLLYLLSGSHDDKVRASLEHVPLSRLPKFDASRIPGAFQRSRHLFS